MPCFITKEFLTRSFIRKNPDDVFVFGDNLERRGTGGQAKEMRGEPNCIGLATKRSPKYDHSAFFDDSDYDEIVDLIEQDFINIEEAAKTRNVYIPVNYPGSGLADLPNKAPKLWEYIKNRLDTLIT